MKWRKRRYFEILAPRSSLRQRVAYSLVIVRLILVPVIFLGVCPRIPLRSAEFA